MIKLMKEKAKIANETKARLRIIGTALIYVSLAIFLIIFLLYKQTISEAVQKATAVNSFLYKYGLTAFVGLLVLSGLSLLFVVAKSESNSRAISVILAVVALVFTGLSLYNQANTGVGNSVKSHVTIQEPIFNIYGDAAYKPTDFGEYFVENKTSLINDMKQTISVTIVNLSDQTRYIRRCSIDIFYVHSYYNREYLYTVDVEKELDLMLQTNRSYTIDLSDKNKDDIISAIAKKTEEMPSNETISNSRIELRFLWTEDTGKLYGNVFHIPTQRVTDDN